MCQIAFCASEGLLDKPNWDAWSFLIGDWVGEGGGGPGEGSGGFSFELDLQRQILVRKNYAEYPATQGKPAFRHDDLMVIYQESAKPMRAIYFDSEGNIINYTVQFSDDQSRIIFLSDIVTGAPRFRFAFLKLNPGQVKIQFEIAPPGNPDEFAPYIQASARKK